MKSFANKEMDNHLKIQSIFPSSISEISYAGESQFGTFLIPHRTQTLADYQIKINGPESTKFPQYDEQKVEKQNTSTFQIQQNMLVRPIQAQYNTTSTGYYLNKDSFSQQQILKAFNIIDVNKDNLITEDDLTFVLEYIRQQFTQEEVREMIDMISADKKHVSFEEFKKLGRGQIIPLAKYKINGKNLKQKSTILNNIQRTQLLKEDPNFLVDCLKKDSISYAKFQQSKKGVKVVNNFVRTQTNVRQRIFDIMQLKSVSQVQQRRNQFMGIVATNVNDIVQNYLQHRDKMVGINKIANILQITLKQVKELYPQITEIDSLTVMLEAIVYSQLKLSKMIDMCLELANEKKTVSIGQIVYIVQIIKGRDESIEKKIQAIVSSKRIQDPIPKDLALQIVLEYSNKLFGTR